MTTSIKDILNDLHKKKLDVVALSDDASPCTVGEWISTGCLALDRICGGGLPVGRMTEIYGENSTGKSLIASQVMAVAQDAGHIAALADTETAAAKSIMEAVGVDLDNLIYSSPDTVEEVFSFFEEVIASKRLRYPDKVLLLVWDSVAATSSMHEMENEYGKTGYLDHARIISQAMRKITRTISKDKVCMLFLNQVRENMGVMFGDKKTTFGGKAISFHASLRIELTMRGKIKDAAKKTIGREAVALVVKNRVAPPFQEALLPVYFGSGIDDAGSALAWLKANDYVIAPKNAREYTVTFDNDEKVTAKSWAKYFDAHYNEIADVMLQDIGVSSSIPDNAADVEDE